MHPRPAPIGLRLVAVTIALASASAPAQLSTPDPDWREAEAPPAPAFKQSGLIPLEIGGATLRYGVDPATVSLSADGIVRYVVVASTGSGTSSAIYEGIRCSTAEVKAYARHNEGTGWTLAQPAQWQPLQANPSSRHSQVIARTGACMGGGANRSATQIVRDLRAPVDTRFNN